MEQDPVSTTTVLCWGRNQKPSGIENVSKGDKVKFKPTRTHTPVGSDSCSTITSAGIMKMSSMSRGVVDGRAYVFVIRST